ncbi:MAG: alpha-glucan family phosphorylase [Lentisphaeria bacterium]|nr:alpha-glucan family phosphorylase [Lentisphaeria bacterium]
MNLKLFNVAPSIPEELKFLETLSYNMWWCWHPLAIELFLRIDPNLWRRVEGNSRRFMNMIPQERLEELAHDRSYLQTLRAVQEEFERDVPEDPGFAARRMAYFSMEFGIHESIRIFSGGLGILSGDHLKAASDLRLPLVSVGLLYRQGYFRQVLDRNGWQIERYPANEINHMPLIRARDARGRSITISIPLMDKTLYAAVWLLWVGTIPLVLLDTEIAENPPEFREITWRLYGGDKTMRIRQELLLGYGGYKALIALGCRPEVCHMNEGHAAFMPLARLEELVRNGIDAETALEIVWRTNVFTTHTPVPAGNEVFEIGLARPYLEPIARAIGIDVDRIIRWGVPIGEREHAKEMSMTVLGLRMANYSNGVSRLHGEVARAMWKNLWPQRSVAEIPITHITNGVHISSWVAPRMRELFDRYLGANWALGADAAQLCQSVSNIPDEELWMAHELCRQSVIRYARKTISSNPSLAGHCAGKTLLDPDALTIGFARRFATYKRGALLLRDPARLLALLTNKARPVQFVFAGKAHPADDAGKKLIQNLVLFAREHGVQDRLLFLEDYDIALARKLVQGVDVWLNNPRRPQEASGTSGMKAAVNGVINCSILDGWWAEAYTPECGWAIRGNENYTNDDDADNFEAQSLFTVLEDEIIPCFYERGAGDLPTRWIQIMKGSIVMSLGNFSSARMVQEYEDMFYEPAAAAFRELTRDNNALAVQLVEKKRRLVNHFNELRINNPTASARLENIHIGDTIVLSTEVDFGGLSPDELDVEVYYGTVDVHNEILEGHVQLMQQVRQIEGNRYQYSCRLECRASGRFGLTTRITPKGNDWDNSIPGFICWPKD